ncbi:MAG: hypothetical protein Q9207_003752 [Kuettlingeria erythrocarpa]
MHLPIFLLLATPLLALAAPAPKPGVGPPSGININVYEDVDCKGKATKYPNAEYRDRFLFSPARKSYSLSKDLGEKDYLTMQSEKPFVIFFDSPSVLPPSCKVPAVGKKHLRQQTTTVPFLSPSNRVILPSHPSLQLTMHASTLLTLTTPLFALAAAAAAPPSPPATPITSGIAISVFTGRACTGMAGNLYNAAYGIGPQFSAACISYRLSKDLGKVDYLYFGSNVPFVAEGENGKAGCHDLKTEAFFLTFYLRRKSE